jgi:hypothetical protein
MFITFEDRPSESPLVERIWTARSQRAGPFHSMAASECELVVTRLRGAAFLTVRGPETRATVAECPGEGEWVAIRLALGTFAPAFLPALIRDRQDVTLPDASSRSFWLNGSAWEYPTWENADTFVARLVRRGLIVREPLVQSVLRGDRAGLSLRSLQRRFVHATGLTHTAHRSIQRARYAVQLLRAGAPLADVVDRAGYFDQPHLTHACRRLIGQTPSEIARGARQLSFLYKTDPVDRL